MNDPVCCMMSNDANSPPGSRDPFSRFLFTPGEATRRKFLTEDMDVAPESLRAAFSR